MQDLTRKRIIRKLEALPDAQLYQVLDYIEFLESKYARERTVPESALERFAERVEEGMRARAVAAGVMSRTMGALGTAARLLDDLAAAGRKAFALPETPAGGTPATSSALARVDPPPPPALRGEPAAPGAYERAPGGPDTGPETPPDNGPEGAVSA